MKALSFVSGRGPFLPFGSNLRDGLSKFRPLPDILGALRFFRDRDRLLDQLVGGRPKMCLTPHKK